MTCTNAVADNYDTVPPPVSFIANVALLSADPFAFAVATLPFFVDRGGGVTAVAFLFFFFATKGMTRR